MSAISQYRPAIIEINGLKTATLRKAKQLRVTVKETVQWGMSNVLKVSLQTTIHSLADLRMASAPDCTRAWDQPRDRWPRAGEQVNSTITTHVLLAVVRRDDQRLESQLRQSRGRNTGKGWVMTTLLKIPLWAARWVYRRMGRNCPPWERIMGTGDLCKIYQERGQPYGL